MKTYTLICLTMITIAFTQAHAQDKPETEPRWTLPENVPLTDVVNYAHNNGVPGTAASGLAFRVEYYKNNCGYRAPYLQWQSGFVQDIEILITLRGTGCDGKTVDVLFTPKVPPGVWYKDVGNYHLFNTNSDVGAAYLKTIKYEIAYEMNGKTYMLKADFEKGTREVLINGQPLSDILKQKVKTKTDINTSIQNYNQQYTTIEAKINKIQDVTQRENLKKRLTQNMNLFNQYHTQAQQQINANDLNGLQQTLDNIKQQQEELKSIDSDINTAKNTVATTNQPTTNTSNTYNNKNTNSLYNGTITSNNANSNKTTTNTYAQQFQQWQNNNTQTQQNNATIANNVGEMAQSLLQQKSDAEQKKRDEEYNKTMAKLQQYKDEMNERLETQKEANRQTSIDMYQILYYEGSSILPHYTTDIPDSAKQSFYITYEREYTSNMIKLRTYTLNKYADGTWMSKSDIKRKINFTETMESSSMYAELIGMYDSQKDALDAIKKIKENASAITSNINIDKSFTPINTPTKNTNANFWNN